MTVLLRQLFVCLVAVAVLAGGLQTSEAKKTQEGSTYRQGGNTGSGFSRSGTAATGILGSQRRAVPGGDDRSGRKRDVV